MLSTYKHHFAEILVKHIDLPLEDILVMIEVPPENIPGDFEFFSNIQYSTFNIQHSRSKILIEYMSANPNKPLHI